jgi:hypothetical protein
MPYKNPDRQRAAKREHARRKRASGVEPKRGTPLLSGDVRIATARDVLGVIEGQVAAVLDDGELATAERARTIATLSGVALRAIEQADLAARVEALERALP